MTAIGATRQVVDRPPGWTYVWWVAVGALVGFGFLAMLSVGAPFLVLGVLLAAGGVALPATRSASVTALPAGLGLPLLLIAWLNRDGPGTICTTTARSVSCEEQWSPWPWLAAAVVLVLVAAAATVAVRLRSHGR